MQMSGVANAHEHAATGPLYTAYVPPELSKLAQAGNVRLVSASESKLCLVRDIRDALHPGAPPSTQALPSSAMDLANDPANTSARSPSYMTEHDHRASENCEPRGRDQCDNAMNGKRPRDRNDDEAAAGDTRGAPRIAQEVPQGEDHVTSTPDTNLGSGSMGVHDTVSDLDVHVDPDTDPGPSTAAASTAKICSLCKQARPPAAFKDMTASCTTCRHYRKLARDRRIDIDTLQRHVRDGTVEQLLTERSQLLEATSRAANDAQWQHCWSALQEDPTQVSEGAMAPPQWADAWKSGRGGDFSLGPNGELCGNFVAPVETAAQNESATASRRGEARSSGHRTGTPELGDDDGRQDQSPGTENGVVVRKKGACTVCLAPGTGARCRACNVYCARAHHHGVPLDVLRVAVQEGWVQDLLPLRRHGIKTKHAKKPGERVCPNCEASKPVSCFGHYTSSGKERYDILCDVCSAANARARARAADLAKTIGMSDAADTAEEAQPTEEEEELAMFLVNNSKQPGPRGADAPDGPDAPPSGPTRQCELCDKLMPASSASTRCANCTALFAVRPPPTLRSAAPRTRHAQLPEGSHYGINGSSRLHSGHGSGSEPGEHGAARRRDAGGLHAPENHHAAAVLPQSLDEIVDVDAVRMMRGVAEQLLQSLGTTAERPVVPTLENQIRQVSALLQQYADGEANNAPPQEPRRSSYTGAEKLLYQTIADQMDRNSASLNLPESLGIARAKQASQGPVPRQNVSTPAQVDMHDIHRLVASLQGAPPVHTDRDLLTGVRGPPWMLADQGRERTQRNSMTTLSAHIGDRTRWTDTDPNAASTEQRTMHVPRPVENPNIHRSIPSSYQVSRPHDAHPDGQRWSGQLPTSRAAPDNAGRPSSSPRRVYERDSSAADSRATEEALAAAVRALGQYTQGKRADEAPASHQPKPSGPVHDSSAYSQEVALRETLQALASAAQRTAPVQRPGASNYMGLEAYMSAHAPSAAAPRAYRDDAAAMHARSRHPTQAYADAHDAAGRGLGSRQAPSTQHYPYRPAAHTQSQERGWPPPPMQHNAGNAPQRGGEGAYSAGMPGRSTRINILEALSEAARAPNPSRFYDGCALPVPRDMEQAARALASANCCATCGVKLEPSPHGDNSIQQCESCCNAAVQAMLRAIQHRSAAP